MGILDTVRGVLGMEADESVSYLCADCDARFTELEGDDVVCPYCGSGDLQR